MLIYSDLDDDGRYDPGVEPFTLTDANGDYALYDLGLGSHTIAEQVQPDSRQSLVPDPLLLGESEAYYSTFDSSTGGFTVDNAYGSGNGLWHWSTGRSADGNPNHTPPRSFYYGTGEGALGYGDYDAGQTGGALVSPVIALPAGGSAELSFDYLLQTEQATPYDYATVDVSMNGSSWQTLADNGTVGGLADGLTSWATASIDLSSYAGQNIYLRFTFDTRDAGVNNYEGWYVDDVRVFAIDDPIARNVNFGNLRLVNAGGDLRANEGDLIEVTAEGTGTFQWTVVADNGEIIPGGSSATLIFTPGNSGVYTATVTLDMGTSTNYSDSFQVFVADVSPTIDVGADAAVAEGDTFSRTLTIGDPGSYLETWQVTVDWGDGSQPEVTNHDDTHRDVPLDHAYTQNGPHTVTVRIVNTAEPEEEEFTDSFRRQRLQRRAAKRVRGHEPDGHRRQHREPDGQLRGPGRRKRRAVHVQVACDRRQRPEHPERVRQHLLLRPE